MGSKGRIAPRIQLFELESSLSRHSKGTKNIDKLMKFLDWAVSPEGMKFSFLGIPNVNYKEANGNIEAAQQLAPIHWAFSLVRTGQLTDDIKKYIGVVYPKEAVDNLTLANKIGKPDLLRWRFRIIRIWPASI